MLNAMLHAMFAKKENWGEAKLNAFLDYCSGKSSSPESYIAAEKGKVSHPLMAGGSYIPPQMVLGILGKSLPLNADSGGGTSLVQKTFHPVSDGGARQVSQIVPLCRMVPTVGELDWPKVVQSAQGDEDDAPDERTASAGSVTTAICAALVEADHFWIGARLLWTEGGNKGEYSNVTEFIQSTHTLSFAEELSVAVASGDKFRLYVNSDEFAEYGFAACDWRGDGDFSALSELQFGNTPIIPRILSAYTESSIALMERVPALTILLEELFRDALYYKLERSILNGDGVIRPLGLLQTPGVLSASRLASGDVDAEDFLAMEDYLPAWLQRRSTWVMSKGVMKLLKERAVTEYAAWMYELVQSGYTRLFGHPIVVTDATTLGSAGDVLFGDFSFYVLAVEQEMTLYSSDHHRFRQRRRCFMPNMMVGGKLTLPRSFVKLAA